jgi:hypothetical protein
MSVFFLQRENGDIQIGYTGESHNRLFRLIKDNGALKLLGMMDGDQSSVEEIHEYFDFCRIEDDWFSPVDDLIQAIYQYTHRHSPQPRSYDDDATIKIEPLTRIALDIFAAKVAAQLGRTFNQNQLILYLLEQADEESIQEALVLLQNATASRR